MAARRVLCCADLFGVVRSAIPRDRFHETFLCSLAHTQVMSYRSSSWKYFDQGTTPKLKYRLHRPFVSSSMKCSILQEHVIHAGDRPLKARSLPYSNSRASGSRQIDARPATGEGSHSNVEYLLRSER